LPNFITVEYKKHQDSLVDKSSYRNPSVVWRPPVKSAAEKDNHRTYNNYKSPDGRFSKDHQSGEKGSTWKSRWTQDGIDSNPPPRKDRDDSNRQTEWRKQRPAEDPAQSQTKDSQATAAKPGASAGSGGKSPAGDGWTKVKHPFNKN
jgi:hypothetical protein